LTDNSSKHAVPADPLLKTLNLGVSRRRSKGGTLHPEQSRDPSPRRVNLRRRGLGIVVCLGPVALLVASLVTAIVSRSANFAGLYLAIAGLAIALTNVFLSILCPMLYLLRHGSFEGYRHASGIPVFGTVLIILAGVWGHGELPTSVVGLVALGLDTGGWPWFLFATWHDESLWSG
jgi:hypothetical protein